MDKSSLFRFTPSLPFHFVYSPPVVNFTLKNDSATKSMIISMIVLNWSKRGDQVSQDTKSTSRLSYIDQN